MTDCLRDIAETVDITTPEYTWQLHDDPVALADRLAAVEIKTESTVSGTSKLGGDE